MKQVLAHYKDVNNPFKRCTELKKKENSVDIIIQAAQCPIKFFF